ncbi:MAG: translocation/assembly module TamB domain-containing protein [Candidatus Marisimplicoccus sp.]
MSDDQFVKGNINFQLDNQNKLYSFQESFLEFSLCSGNFNFLDKDLADKTIIQGDIIFEGLKEEIIFEKLNLKTELLELNTTGILKDILTSDYEVSLDLSDINISEEEVSKALNLNQEFTLPILFGNINLNDGFINYNFSKINTNDSSANIYGTGLFEDKTSFDFNIILDLLKDDELLAHFNLDNLKMVSRFSIVPDQQITFNGDIEIVNNDNTTNVDFNTSIVNNNLSSKLGITKENVRLDYEIYGNLLNKKLNAFGKIFLETIPVDNINHIIAETNIEIDFSVKNNIKSNLKLKEISIDILNDKIYLTELSEINEILENDFIETNNNYDFSFQWVDNKLNLESNLGSNILINGFYKNENDIDLNFEFSNLFIQNFFEINKSPISGNVESKINLNRTELNRTLSLNASIRDINIKEYEIGDLEINAFGNTDFDSYSVDLKLLNNENISLKSEGTVIAINEKPNLDLDLNFNDFDISFIEKIGSNTLKNISSSISGQVNLWGSYDNLQHNGNLILNKSKFLIPYLNIEYLINNNSELTLYNQNIEFTNILITHSESDSFSSLDGNINHTNYNDWNLDLVFESDRLFILNKDFDEDENFYGKAYIDGQISISGPTDQVSIDIDALTMPGTYITIPRTNSNLIDDFSFIEFTDLNNSDLFTKNNLLDDVKQLNNKTLDLNIDLEIDNNAQVDITIDQETGSYISGIGNGNLFMEIDSDGKFNIFGDYTTTEGEYNFKDLALIDKKFKLKDGGTIVWDGEPLGAQMDILATYEVPGGANPALLLDNPNFNKKIPTDVEIELTGNLTKPNSPDFEIYFPNTSSSVTSEINYKLNDPEVRQLQAISLLTQGIFINEVSVSIEGITNNIYEKVSDIFSDLLGGSEGPLKVGINYLQGDKSDILDIKTEDRFGVTLSTEISEKILFNGKIGVPIGGIEETLIIGDVQIDFILNVDGSLKAKVFNRENEFRYIGDKLGYTQGVGLTYQVDFQTFRDLISKLLEKNR